MVHFNSVYLMRGLEVHLSLFSFVFLQLFLFLFHFVVYFSLHFFAAENFLSHYSSFQFWARFLTRNIFFSAEVYPPALQMSIPFKLLSRTSLLLNECFKWLENWMFPSLQVLFMFTRFSFSSWFGIFHKENGYFVLSATVIDFSFPLILKVFKQYSKYLKVSL